MALVAPAGEARKRRLRIGLFADARMQPSWIVQAFARVAASDFAVVALLAVGPDAGARLPWPLAVYGKLDRLAFGAEPSQPACLEQGVPHQQRLDAVTPAQLAPLALDVAFAVGDVDADKLEGVARYGVWRFCFGADGAVPAALAGFDEVARGDPLSVSGIEVRLPGDAPRVAYRSWSRSLPFSVARTRARYLSKTGEFAYRALRELHRSGPGWLRGCRTLPAPAARPRAPGLLELGRIGGQILQRARQRALSIEQWQLAFRFGALSGPAVRGDLDGFTRIVPPRDRDWADPFVLEKSGRYYVFFEELPYAAGKGHISMLEIAPDGSWSSPVRVLERDYHLSYPFLIEHEGGLYMIPETAQNRSVEAYRCIDFPRGWRLERTLLDGVRCVDATFHRARERWWMFANAAPGDSNNFDDELHLFHSDGLFGDWRPHPQNPVKSDARCARPAGRLFARGASWYRPAQVCVPRYGAGLAIQRVQRLTPHEYAEREVRRILPAEAAGFLGVHTLNRAGALTVVDAFVRRSRL